MLLLCLLPVKMKKSYHRLKMYEIPDQGVEFIEKTMQTLRVELTTGGQRLAEVNI